jgi:4-aminobutyrate aminotransferase-like enzyme
MKFIGERGIDYCRDHHRADQGEGGDNHFRGRWLPHSPDLVTDDMLLIFDEVQCGAGTTGKNWCCRNIST